MLLTDNIKKQGILIPDRMGKPRADQMIGTWAECLSELCGRICYDSLGKGRSSAEYHAHVLEVGHLSVYEHPHVTVEVVVPPHMLSDCLLACLNKPALRVRRGDGDTLRITMNLRHMIEWDDQAMPTRFNVIPRSVLRSVAPQIDARLAAPRNMSLYDYTLVGPETDTETYLSYLMVGSRGFSHEQVRHGDWSAISQRSTRYCDEDTTPYVTHPLLQEYLDTGGTGYLRQVIKESMTADRHTYRCVVKELDSWLRVVKKLDAGTARKQARGAARGYLGNALETELIFTASAAQWHHMERLRLHPAADREINDIYARLDL